MADDDDERSQFAHREAETLSGEYLSTQDLESAVLESLQEHLDFQPLLPATNSSSREDDEAGWSTPEILTPNNSQVIPEIVTELENDQEIESGPISMDVTTSTSLEGTNFALERVLGEVTANILTEAEAEASKLADEFKQLEAEFDSDTDVAEPHSILTCRVCQLFVRTVDRLLDKSEELEDHYLPLTEEEIENLKQATLQLDESSIADHQMQVCLDRINNLSSKLRQRAYMKALSKLRMARRNTQESLCQLHETINLIGKVQQEDNSQRRPSFRKLSAITVEWTQRHSIQATLGEVSEVEIEASVLEIGLPLAESTRVEDIEPPLAESTAVEDIEPPLAESIAVEDIEPPLAESIAVEDIGPPLAESTAVEDIGPPLAESTAVEDIEPPLAQSSSLERTVEARRSIESSPKPPVLPEISINKFSTPPTEKSSAAETPPLIPEISPPEKVPPPPAKKRPPAKVSKPVMLVPEYIRRDVENITITTPGCEEWNMLATKTPPDDEDNEDEEINGISLSEMESKALEMSCSLALNLQDTYENLLVHLKDLPDELKKKLIQTCKDMADLRSDFNSAHHFRDLSHGVLDKGFEVMAEAQRSLDELMEHALQSPQALLWLKDHLSSLEDEFEQEHILQDTPAPAEEMASPLGQEVADQSVQNHQEIYDSKGAMEDIPSNQEEPTVAPEMEILQDDISKSGDNEDIPITEDVPSKQEEPVVRLEMEMLQNDVPKPDDNEDIPIMEDVPSKQEEPAVPPEMEILQDDISKPGDNEDIPITEDIPSKQEEPAVPPEMEILQGDISKPGDNEDIPITEDVPSKQEEPAVPPEIEILQDDISKPGDNEDIPIMEDVPSKQEEPAVPPEMEILQGDISKPGDNDDIPIMEDVHSKQEEPVVPLEMEMLQDDVQKPDDNEDIPIMEGVPSKQEEPAVPPEMEILQDDISKPGDNEDIPITEDIPSKQEEPPVPPEMEILQGDISKPGDNEDIPITEDMPSKQEETAVPPEIEILQDDISKPGDNEDIPIMEDVPSKQEETAVPPEMEILQGDISKPGDNEDIPITEDVPSKQEEPVVPPEIEMLQDDVPKPGDNEDIPIMEDVISKQEEPVVPPEMEMLQDDFPKPGDNEDIPIMEDVPSKQEEPVVPPEMEMLQDNVPKPGDNEDIPIKEEEVPLPEEQKVGERNILEIQQAQDPQGCKDVKPSERGGQEGHVFKIPDFKLPELNIMKVIKDYIPKPRENEDTSSKEEEVPPPEEPEVGERNILEIQQAQDPQGCKDVEPSERGEQEGHAFKIPDFKLPELNIMKVIQDYIPKPRENEATSSKEEEVPPPEEPEVGERNILKIQQAQDPQGCKDVEPSERGEQEGYAFKIPDFKLPELNIMKVIQDYVPKPHVNQDTSSKEEEIPPPEEPEVGERNILEIQQTQDPQGCKDVEPPERGEQEGHAFKIPDFKLPEFNIMKVIQDYVPKARENEDTSSKVEEVPSPEESEVGERNILEIQQAQDPQGCKDVEPSERREQEGHVFKIPNFKLPELNIMKVIQDYIPKPRENEATSSKEEEVPPPEEPEVGERNILEIQQAQDPQGCKDVEPSERGEQEGQPFKSRELNIMKMLQDYIPKPRETEATLTKEEVPPLEEPEVGERNILEIQQAQDPQGCKDVEPSKKGEHEGQLFKLPELNIMKMLQDYIPKPRRTEATSSKEEEVPPPEEPEVGERNVLTVQQAQDPKGCDEGEQDGIPPSTGAASLTSAQQKAGGMPTIQQANDPQGCNGGAPHGQRDREDILKIQQAYDPQGCVDPFSAKEKEGPASGKQEEWNFFKLLQSYIPKGRSAEAAPAVALQPPPAPPKPDVKEAASPPQDLLISPRKLEEARWDILTIQRAQDPKSCDDEDR